MKNPKISVLMTVYNGEKYLSKTIKSILNQTFKNFEFIIVDDGSTDNTKKVIKEYEKKDSRIKYIYYGKNKGYENLHNVVNRGLDECSGKYIARTDADDISYKDRLNIQHEYLEKHPRIFMIGSSADVIDEYGKRIGELKKKSWPSIVLKYTVGFNNPFIHSSIMFRNEGLKYPSHSEHYFFVQAVVLGRKLKNLRKNLVAYRINPEGLVAKSKNLEKNRYKDLYKE
jgi:glycosyltransferase involved in cell wall biosynthesis